MEKIELILKATQEFRSQLESWGVTTDYLIYVGLGAFLLFIVSLREVLGWYLRTNALRAEIRVLGEQVYQMQQSLDQIRDHLDDSKKKSWKSEQEAEDRNLKPFRLDN